MCSILGLWSSGKSCWPTRYAPLWMARQSDAEGGAKREVRRVRMTEWSCLTLSAEHEPQRAQRMSYVDIARLDEYTCTETSRSCP